MTKHHTFFGITLTDNQRLTIVTILLLGALCLPFVLERLNRRSPR